MTFDITKILEIVLALISAIITTFVIPVIKEKLSETKREKLRLWVDVALKAAEQLYGSKTVHQKKEYVVSFLLSKGIVFDVDEVTALIESSVYKLSAEQM